MKPGKRSYTVRWLFAPLALVFGWTGTLAVQVPDPLVDTGGLVEQGGTSANPEPQIVALEDVAEEEAARTEETATGEAAEHTAALPLPPRSLQSLVDERRDQLRRRRERYYEAFSGRHFLQPPWMFVHDQRMDVYRDRMREAHRHYRDAMRFHHDVYRSLYMPWSQSFHDWAEARHYALQMEQLDREELWDDMRFGQVYGPAGLFRY